MKVIDQLQETWLDQETVLTIGVFDGVHLGHQTLIHQVVDQARATGRKSGAVTFYPHPANVLRPDVTVPYLTTPGEKAVLFERFGLDMMVLIQFTRELAQQSAGEFVSMLVGHLRPTDIWVGQDFALGRNREGNPDVLRRLGETHGFGVHVVGPVTWQGEAVSSTRIRRLLAEGSMEQVAELLGRYYSIAGEVVPGAKRGRSLGFPTANLRVRTERALPRNGVYATFALLGSDVFPAVANLGVRPTFDDTQRVLEVYFLDTTMELYGCDLVVEFVKWQRPELKFGSAGELIQQMNSDVAEARVVLANADPRRSTWVTTAPECRDESYISTTRIP